MTIPTVPCDDCLTDPTRSMPTEAGRVIYCPHEAAVALVEANLWRVYSPLDADQAADMVAHIIQGRRLIAAAAAQPEDGPPPRAQ